MKGTNLGEFEELVLLTIAALMEEAYSVSICDEIEKVSGREVKLSVVHAVLNRLEKKGFVNSHLGEPTSERGGRRKRFFTVTHAGKVALTKIKEQRDQLWSVIPEFKLNFI
ncbi:PadR family transcriptional regulator [Roseivirga pacifica]|uniref:Transcriptional regulator PadR-like family protein n=1 Tax=Roseivirga pacifica TaxID=1267423 RepID=A0A1I0NXM9_9BACT|nr:PadR family transcriptional regulator [Roseivirga pacifica]MCO6360074.1 PadR family transcriptional regulator [Roseivirga pacifica]MCO6367445.1 PadR family transcriptional regulator [Roseivirga pacifica]MCO6370024.1 PadR family transcriptional regulator [Roseivirga pacifica]MCO6375101.1 PadR family transcriptional regulator [Roseivirga pacifica]MCO6380360.1 PadR family transcriptional regulator [Roseivirga pacifica]|tara:strand:- start:27 stop:359 length:333 start_codon:yes stop_codon:yes gene_type:complete